VYNEHDRPSTQRMVITAAAAVAGIALIIGIASVVFGMSVAHQPNTEAVTAPADKPAVEAPATATASVATAQPAPAATSQVSPAPSVTAPVAAKPAPSAAPVADASLGVVVIDAGHQGTGNSAVEPVGPGSSTKKPKVESGASGVATHVDESKRNLQIALVLQKTLESRGVKVVMVRTTQNVNIPNSKRAQIANNAHAALFIRLHCDSAGSSTHGVLTLRPSKNWYNGIDMVGPSKIAAQDVHKATLAATGAYDRGIVARSDLSGFNWAKVPSVLVEMGLMSNPSEDRKLGTASYQQELATGMANGIVKFLKSR
jgi:N-acetylmuramoyl-L-alanine amidase